MITLTFPDGAKREIEQGLSAAQVAAGISKSLEKKAVAAVVNGVLVDLGAFGKVTLPQQAGDELLGRKVTLGIRPEHLSLREPGFKLALKPAIVERLGIHSVAYSPLPSGENFIALFEGNPRLIENEPMAAYADPAKCHLFDEAGLAISRPGAKAAA